MSSSLHSKRILQLCLSLSKGTIATTRSQTGHLNFFGIQPHHSQPVNRLSTWCHLQAWCHLLSYRTKGSVGFCHNLPPNFFIAELVGSHCEHLFLSQIITHHSQVHHYLTAGGEAFFHQTSPCGTTRVNVVLKRKDTIFFSDLQGLLSWGQGSDSQCCGLAGYRTFSLQVGDPGGWVNTVCFVLRSVVFGNL